MHRAVAMSALVKVNRIEEGGQEFLAKENANESSLSGLESSWANVVFPEVCTSWMCNPTVIPLSVCYTSKLLYRGKNDVIYSTRSDD